MSKRPLLEVQLEKMNGPPEVAAIDALAPASYHPSPVGLAPELEYEPLRVVVSVQPAETDPGDAAIGFDVDVIPLQVVEE